MGKAGEVIYVAYTGEKGETFSPDCGFDMMLFPLARYSVSFVLCVSMLFFSGLAQGEMFACKDSRGKISYTNAPSSGGCVALGAGAKKRRNRWKSPASYDPKAFDRAIWAAGNRYNVDPYLIKAVIRAESGFNSRAVSKKGAQGLMQLMPQTARELRVNDPFNPNENINGGTRYLRRMLNTFNGNLILSIAAYNAGPGAVRRAKGVPKIPETVRYVSKVLNHYKGYKGEAGA